MINFSAIAPIALCEAKLLGRSWAFRLSLGIPLFFLFMFNLGMSLPQSHVPHYFVALPGGLPLGNIRLLNLYMGVIAALLATEFVKRDRRDDTAQTVFVHSFTNVDYVFGKVLGVATVFGFLELTVLTVAAVLHHFFAPLPLVWEPYVMAVLVAVIPTLIFTTGLAVLLVTLVRSQAVVFVVIVAIGVVSVTVVGFRYFFFLDVFAFHIPMMWSDFVGAGNETQLLLVRGTHLLFGLACIAVTPLLSRRLPQSMLASAAAVVVALACAGGAGWAGYTYMDSRWSERDHRTHLRQLRGEASKLSAPTMVACRLEVAQERGGQLAVRSELTMTNEGTSALDTLLLTLNPGLRVEEIAMEGNALAYRRDEHLLRVALVQPLAPADTVRFQLAYRGRIDERFCYLDVEEERLEAQYRLFLHSVPKRYSMVTAEFLHLTPETGWYPRAGVPTGTAFPERGHRDYADYEISVAVPDGWSAFSQGAAETDSLAGVTRFRTEKPLPQVSLTMGEYEVRELEVEDITYRLAIRPGHDYFDTYLDSVSGALPDLITELRNEYEVRLGMDYPHSRFSLVETPIQFFAYERLWTVAQESVQPEIVYLPEMGALCEGCDFRRQKRRSKWRQESANQAETAQDLQIGYVRTFATLDLLALQLPTWRHLDRESGVEMRYKVLPCFLSYVTHLSSDRWPILNYAFESYFREQVEPPETSRARQWQGLTETERASLAVKELGLADLLRDTELPRDTRKAAIKAKGRHLLQLLAAGSGADEFSGRLTAVTLDSRYRGLSDVELIRLIEELGSENPEPAIERWYRSPDLPGYKVDKAESYLVRDGERTRTQVKVEISNPTEVDGLVEVSFRQRENDSERWWMRGAQADVAHETVIELPAGVRKSIGILTDQPVAEMMVDTYLSQNIPSIINIPFSEQKLRRRERPFRGGEVSLLADDPPAEASEYIVDDEDEGFQVHEAEQANYLRRLLVDWFDLREREHPYVGMRWDAPGIWEATTDRRFYGQFVLSGRYKRASDGRSMVSWRAEIERSGDYEIYFYCVVVDESRWGMRRRGRGGWRNNSQLNLQVYHEGGVELVQLDLDQMEEGWTYVGTYRLPSGTAHVELTDRGDGRVVFADAVKWVEKL